MTLLRLPYKDAFVEVSRLDANEETYDIQLEYDIVRDGSIVTEEFTSEEIEEFLNEFIRSALQVTLDKLDTNNVG